jgi:protein-L-isoaspartate(D-aspartate) O-methyltransferase
MTLKEVRRFFAEEIQYFANVKNPALVAAFESVPRETFLGPGPWKIGLAGLVETPDADPRHVYHNVPISLDELRNLNNGQPGALAVWIDALELKTGERVYHLGGGVGYYDAILAEVVGRTGAVVVSEVDTDLATRAQRNLANYPNVTVHAVDGTEFDPGDCDAILINAGCTHLHPCWLDRLRDGGRLMIPLTNQDGITRHGRRTANECRRGNDGQSCATWSLVHCSGALAGRDLLVYKHARRRVRSESSQGNGHGADREIEICPPRPTPAR